MANTEIGLQHILQKIRETPFQKIKVAVTDIDGILRGKYIQKNKFLNSIDTGFGFCSVIFGWDVNDQCYDHSSYTGWHDGYPDSLVKIDLSTFRLIPWEKDVPFFLCDFEELPGKPLPICPRQLLKRIVSKATQSGFKPMFGMEFEWFNFRETPQSLESKNFSSLEPISPGMFGYSILRQSLNQPYFSALMDELRQFGVPLEGLHTETGPGVIEAALLYSDPLEAADRAVLFKTSTKEIAYRFGIVPSFMAKWNSNLPGCGGHIHSSLLNSHTNENLFYDSQDPLKMSSIFKSYLAGQLLCLPELLPMYAPTVNSYKRMVEHFWAPTRINWGVDNRTTAYRVIPGSMTSTRLENRVPGADVNPYLAISACLASGLYGIEKDLELPDLPTGTLHENLKHKRLASNLKEATIQMAKSELANELFGEDFVGHFIQTREWEWKQFEEAVTPWELKRYFEII